MSRRVLAKVISNLGYDYDALDNVDDLEDALASGMYDVVLTDVKLVTEHISNAYANIAIISSCDTKTSQEVDVAKGETIASNPSKEEIENIIKKYRG